MSSEALYEQYKDALKRGHVASLRGRVEEALLAYAEAARIAPERSTPHTSAGTALLRRKRPADALRHFEVALAMAPRDEAAMLGRAQALAALDRRGDAADAFDALAEAQAGGGRLADAVDAARRGLEMAEGRERRRTLERLIAQLRATEPDEPGRLALENALLVLEGQAVPQPTAHHKPAAGSHAHGAQREAGHAEAASGSGTAESVTEPTDELAQAGTMAPGVDATTDAGVAAGSDEEQDAAPAAGAEVAAPSEPEGGLAGSEGAPAEAEGAPAEANVEAVGQEGELAAEPVLGAPARAPRAIPANVTVAELEARAEAALDAGAPEQALEASLDLAALHVREGRIEAALDACYGALSLDPDSVALHLALAELYTQRGWDALAGEKLELLERIARLDGDEAVVAEVAGLRAGRG